MKKIKEIISTLKNEDPIGISITIKFAIVLGVLLFFAISIISAQKHNNNCSNKYVKCKIQVENKVK